MNFLRFLRLFYAALTLVLILNFGLQTAAAQSEAKAFVVLDGRSLFPLGGSDQVSSQDRATLVNRRLKEIVEKSKAAQVTVEERDQVPTVLVNDQDLLSVNRQDVKSDSTPRQQADLWARQIQQAAQQAQIERSSGSLQKKGTVAAVLFAAAFALHWLLGNVTWRLLHLLSRRLAAVEDSAGKSSTVMELFFKLTLAVARLVLWTSVGLYIANLFPWTRQWSYQIINWLRTSFTSPILNLGGNSYSVVALLILAAVLLGWAVLSGALTNVFKTRVLSLAGIGRGAQEAIATLVRYALIVLGTIMLLQIWGLNLSSLTILASAFGLGIGLGLQNIAKNFSSGLVLVFERPIQVGDFIEVGNFKGNVERVGPRSTHIRTLDYVSIIVPNSRFLEEEVINWSHKTPMSRLHLPVGVAYSSDPKEVEAALIEVAVHSAKVLQNPAPKVAFIGFGDSALNFELLIWIEDPSNQFFIKSELFFQIFEMLSRKNIEIPFPQRDLNFRYSGLSSEQFSQLKPLQQQLKTPEDHTAEQPKNQDTENI
jgi:potassium-dependent mechanosensitive channel